MSMVDPCLFISKNVICVVYMDDRLFWVSSQYDIDNVTYIEALSGENS